MVLRFPLDLWLGRVWSEDIGLSTVTLRHGPAFDIITKATPTMRDLLEQVDKQLFRAGLPVKALGRWMR